MIGPDDTFARALAHADIAAIAGVKLFRAGRRLRGPCPLCGASAKKKADGAFSVDPGAKVFKCFACDAGGDAIELEHRLHGRPGESRRDAALRILGEDRPAEPKRDRAPRQAREPQRDEADSEAWKRQQARALWLEARRAVGTPVETYLRGRGLDGPALEAALELLRFHPEAYHSGPSFAGVRLPAMVGLVTAPAAFGGEATSAARTTGGVHVTYLAPDGRGKTKRTPAKRMWGPQGCDGRPGGVWLTAPTAPGPLVVGEGIESTLSAVQLIGGPCRAVATLSLRALQGGWLADRWGRKDPDVVRPDPEAPAFTWPEPAGAPWGEVLVCVDRDMSPIKVKARKAAGGGSFDLSVDGEARARVCAGLAVAAWRKAGVRNVRPIAPGAGRDFNDELQFRVGRAA